LLFLGADVTTKGVGMVDPVWPTVPWYLLENSWVERGVGFLVEHGHRAFGYAVGCCAILMVGAVLAWEKRPYVRRLAVIGLLGVCIQGLLGGLRVRLISTELAMVHGCFGQLVFSLLVTLAFTTSRWWSTDARLASPQATQALRLVGLFVVGLLIFQLVMGAMIRHEGSRLGQRLHLLNAFAVLLAICWLVKVVGETPLVSRLFAGPRWLLVGLLVLQLSLGVEAWMLRFSDQPAMMPSGWFLNRDLVRTLHVLVGSLVLATAVSLTLETHRRTAWTRTTPDSASADGLEGAL
jgi:cytochrome c oxidase assembly protein subunit 15